MPVIYREDGEAPAWGMVAVLLVGILVILLLGYFLWWQPNISAAPDRDETTIIQPAPQPSPAPNPVIVPVPGPAGPPGPQGPQGPAGPAAPSAPSGGATAPGTTE